MPRGSPAQACDALRDPRAAALRGRLDGPDRHAALAATTRRSRDIGFDELAELFSQQAHGLLAGGADLLIIETMQDVLEAARGHPTAPARPSSWPGGACRSRCRSRST